MILRFNEEAEAAGKPAWPLRVGVAVRCRAPQSNGFPGGDDLAPLTLIEDTIEGSVEGNRGVLAFVVTTAGMREFVSYVDSAETAASVRKAARDAASDYEIQGYSEPDPAWAAYEGFRPGQR